MAFQNICIFGDSVTWGPYLPYRVAWANLLRNHLEKNAVDQFRVYDLGVDMDTTKDVLKRIEVEAIARKPSIIVIAIGVNDSLFRETENNPETGLEDYIENVQKLITIARKYVERILIVGLVKGSDKWTTPLIQSTTGKSYTKERTHRYDRALKELAEKNKIPFADVNDQLGDDDFDDGLHPNTVGHTKMFAVISRELDPLLGLVHDKYATLVDENDQEIGRKLLDQLTSEDITRVAALWIENTNGEVLIAKRPADKRRDPNRWAPAVATMVDEKETYLAAIKNAAERELGLAGVQLSAKDKVRVKGYNNFFCQLYYLKQDLEINLLKIAANEVQSVQWIKKDELKKNYQNNPQFFVQSFGDYLAVFSE